MNMSNWQDYNFEQKIEMILSDIEYYKPEHHFGRPFITAYQLAIEFAHRFPADVTRLGYQIGGEGIGERVSLAQYLAHQLSDRIKTGDLANIEGGFLSNNHLSEVLFDNNGQQIKSSLTKTPFDLSMFRLRK
jgi:hypothetical protein